MVVEAAKDVIWFCVSCVCEGGEYLVDNETGQAYLLQSMPEITELFGLSVLVSACAACPYLRQSMTILKRTIGPVVVRIDLTVSGVDPTLLGSVP